jgi:hypothetical protein
MLAGACAHALLRLRTSISTNGARLWRACRSSTRSRLHRRASANVPLCIASERDRRVRLRTNTTRAHTSMRPQTLAHAHTHARAPLPSASKAQRLATCICSKLRTLHALGHALTGAVPRARVCACAGLSDALRACGNGAALDRSRSHLCCGASSCSSTSCASRTPRSSTTMLSRAWPSAERPPPTDPVVKHERRRLALCAVPRRALRRSNATATLALLPQTRALSARRFDARRFDAGSLRERSQPWPLDGTHDAWCSRWCRPC